jgi:hypothetical protein
VRVKSNKLTFSAENKPKLEAAKNKTSCIPRFIKNDFKDF